IADPDHVSVIAETISLYVCPSDWSGGTFSAADSAGVALAQVAFANYVGCAGTSGVSNSPDTGTRVLFRNSAIRMADIPDGLGTTLFVGERTSRRAPQTTWVGAVTDAVIPAYGFDPDGPPVMILTSTGTAAGARVPNSEAGRFEDVGSLHTGLVNYLMCDGS